MYKILSVGERNGMPSTRRVLSPPLKLVGMLGLGIVIGAATAAFSQDQKQSDPSDAQRAPSSQVQDDSRQASEEASSASGQSESEPKEADKEKQSRGSIVAAPLPISSPALGAGVVPVLGYIFPFSRNDKVSPPSIIGAAGLITDDGSRGFGIGAQLYLKENKYQVQAIFASGNLNYDLYGEGLITGNKEARLPLSQTGRVFFGEGLRNIGHKIFVGPRVWIGTSTVTLQNQEIDGVTLPDIGLHTTLVALGFVITRDTRANRFYPLGGSFIKFSSDFFTQGLGSKYSFQAYRFTFSKYWSLTDRQVLAYNLFFCGTGGAPPFYGNCIYGANNELRGYQAGRHLDRYMVATQLEYRLVLPKRFGVVGFGGLGGVVPGSDQFFRRSAFLPDIGGGLRFELSKKYHVNLRADAARGNNSGTWGIGVGEAF